MRPSLISLFTGAGGLDFGFEAASFQTRVVVELDSACRKALGESRGWPIADQDGRYALEAISSEVILKIGGLRSGEVDVLIAGPPCQPFSKAGYWATGDAPRLEDPRAKTLSGFLRVLRDTKPRAFLLENVHGFAYQGKDEGLNHVLRGVERVNHEARTNYRVHSKVLDAADYGVPQHRQRVLLVASRDGTPFDFPKATHGPGRDHSYRNTWDAIGDLDNIEQDETTRVRGKWGDLLPSIPEGENYLWHTSRGGGKPLFGWRTRYWTFLLKLAKKRPAWTLSASPGTATGPFHWRSRRLNTKEMCRLQTLPENMRFSCSYIEAQRLIGNAVPSLLAEVLAREIRVQILGDRRPRIALKLMPPDRGAAPAPERPKPVPKKYNQMIGDHPPHPGARKGPGACRREERLT